MIPVIPDRIKGSLGDDKSQFCLLHILRRHGRPFFFFLKKKKACRLARILRHFAYYSTKSVKSLPFFDKIPLRIWTKSRGKDCVSLQFFTVSHGNEN